MSDIEKAIEVFEKPSKHIYCVHGNKNGMQFFTYSQHLVKAFEVAISVLQKEIPKKLTEWSDGTKHCPNGDCEQDMTALGFKRCICCGQSLDLNE